jgi:hypothetical protein
MDQEILKVFFYDVWCAIVLHYYLCLYVLQYADMLQTVWKNSIIVLLMFVQSQKVHI